MKRKNKTGHRVGPLPHLSGRIEMPELKKTSNLARISIRGKLYLDTVR
ncbi:MAG TPA: hypothetical protein PLP19_22485 [bacterium]|nr:hypothetical protein [bacterium]